MIASIVASEGPQYQQISPAAPYAGRGWRPNGPQLNLPQQTYRAPLQQSQPQSSYGPPPSAYGPPPPAYGPPTQEEPEPTTTEQSPETTTTEAVDADAAEPLVKARCPLDIRYI